MRVAIQNDCELANTSDTRPDAVRLVSGAATNKASWSVESINFKYPIDVRVTILITSPLRFIIDEILAVAVITMTSG